jgi:hypothetical protein
MVRLGGLDKLKKKKFNDLIGNGTRDFLACSIVPQTNYETACPLSHMHISKCV